MELLLFAVLALGVALAARCRRRPYDIVETLGHGDLSDVHRATRGGASFVLKVPKVAGHDALGAKEVDVLRSLREPESPYRACLPEPVESFALEGRRVNAFAWREGHVAATALPKALDPRHVAWMFNRTLELLGFVHRRGWIHGAVLPPHLLFHPADHGLLLAGWIHAERPPAKLRLIPAAYADWYPPEVRAGGASTPSVDLYLAAKSMLHLAGEERLPADVRRFLRGCLLDSPRMRCQDAWQLRDEFAAVLDRVYGPPAFVPLSLD